MSPPFQHPRPLHALSIDALLDAEERKYWVIALSEIYHETDRRGGLADSADYAVYYALGRLTQPESILEIGVKYGYSLASLACGAKLNENVFGLDLELSNTGSNRYATESLSRIGIKSTICRTSIGTECISAVTGRNSFDLIHIDLGDYRQTQSEILEDLMSCAVFSNRLLLRQAFSKSSWEAVKMFIASREAPTSVGFFNTSSGVVLLQL